MKKLNENRNAVLLNDLIYSIELNDHIAAGKAAIWLYDTMTIRMEASYAPLGVIVDNANNLKVAFNYDKNTRSWINLYTTNSERKGFVIQIPGINAHTLIDQIGVDLYESHGFKKKKDN